MNPCQGVIIRSEYLDKIGKAVSRRYDIEHDLKEVEAMIESLNSYVRGDALYGNVGGGGMFAKSNMSRLTIGGLTMRFRRLHQLSAHLNDEQLLRLQEAHAGNQDVMHEWHLHYEKKMLREAKSRLNAMSTFFTECKTEPETAAHIYGPEALRRTIVQELFIAMKDYGIDSGDLQKQMMVVDNRLRDVIEPCAFIWDDLLQPLYSEDDFWWLYGSPAAQGK